MLEQWWRRLGLLVAWISMLEAEVKGIIGTTLELGCSGVVSYGADY